MGGDGDSLHLHVRSKERSSRKSDDLFKVTWLALAQLQGEPAAPESGPGFCFTVVPEVSRAQGAGREPRASSDAGGHKRALSRPEKGQQGGESQQVGPGAHSGPTKGRAGGIMETQGSW